MRPPILSVFFFFLQIAASAFFLPGFAYALEIGVQPEHPTPGQTVTLTISDFEGSADNTSYVWSINKKLIDQGVGKTSISFTAGALGSSYEVQVLAVENGRARGSVSTTVRPAMVDIVWEGNTSTPPLYLGRPLPNGQSTVTVLAMPHLFLGTKEVPSSGVIYTWKVNGTLIQKQSGYGKQSASVSPPRFGSSFTVFVQAATPDGRVTAENSVVITPRTPTAVVYENAPLLGLRFDKAVNGSFPFTTDEVSFVAYPLFVSNPDNLSYAWSLDGAAFDTDTSKPRAVTFRKVGAGTGTHEVSFSFKNSAHFLEGGEKKFQLKF